VHEEINSKYKWQFSSFGSTTTTTSGQYLDERLKTANVAEKLPATISQKTRQDRNYKVEHGLVHDKPQKKSTHWSTIWRTTNRKKKKNALEHDLVHDKPPKKNASEHDLVHDKPQKKARIGARFGARQTAKKSTHRSTIWCTTNRKEKQALEHDLVEKNSHIILAPAQQQTWQTSR